MASYESTTVDPVATKRSRVLEMLLDSKYDNMSNRQLSRLILVDESMVRKYRKQLGKASKYPQSGLPKAERLRAKRAPALGLPAEVAEPAPSPKTAKPKRKPAAKKPVGKGKAKRK